MSTLYRIHGMRIHGILFMINDKLIWFTLVYSLNTWGIER